MAIRPMEPSGQCESELAAVGVALPELLAPAGGLDQMLAAIAAGADAIYAGLDGFNARVSAHGFNDDEFARGCAVAHAHGGQGLGGLTDTGLRVRNGRITELKQRTRK